MAILDWFHSTVREIYVNFWKFIYLLIDLFMIIRRPVLERLANIEMITMEWFRMYVESTVADFWGIIHFVNDSQITFRGVLLTYLLYLEGVIMEWCRGVAMSISTFCTEFLNLKTVLLTTTRRSWLLIRSIWDARSFADLLSLQRDYEEAKHSQRSIKELCRLEEFGNYMNYSLVVAARLCLREIRIFQDLIETALDLFQFVWLYYMLCRSALRYVYAKKLTRVSAISHRVISMMADNYSRTLSQDVQS